MARSNTAAAVAETSENEDEAIERTDPIDVTDGEQTRALLAGWRYLYHFFNARLTPSEEFPSGWEVITEGPNKGDVIAHGFTVEKGSANPRTLLRDISGRVRRMDFGPAFLYVNGDVPEPVTDPQEMQNFLVNFSKGNGEDGTSKTPAYAREAVAKYKADHGLRTRRGRKRTIIRLDSLENVNPEMLQGLDINDLQKLIDVAEVAKARGSSPVAVANNANGNS